MELKGDWNQQQIFEALECTFASVLAVSDLLIIVSLCHVYSVEIMKAVHEGRVMSGPTPTIKKIACTAVYRRFASQEHGHSYG